MITIDCIQCGKKTVGKNTLKKYCSDSCKQKLFRKNSPENVRAIRKRYYEDNREEILRKDREDYWNGGKTKSKETSKIWYLKNKAYRKIYTKKYRNKNRILFAKYKDIERFGGNKEVVLFRDLNKCKCCNSTKRLVIHHIDGSGGNSHIGYSNTNNSLDNLIALCSSCHARLHGYQKRTKTMFKSIEDILGELPIIVEEYKRTTRY